MRHQRRGFTLIEVLVVIGIILALITVLVLGMRHLNVIAAHKETVAELHICRDMLTEYENHNGTGFILTIYPVNSVIGPVAGDVSNHNAGGQRYVNGAIVNTAKLMQILERVPANRNEVQTIQTKRILEPPPLATAKTLDEAGGGAVLLDGWGNPIILVPAGGLRVNISDVTQNPPVAVSYIIRSTGTFLASQLGTHPVTPADRPFFASAGQDGDFSFGEDNVYSFQE